MVGADVTTQEAMLNDIRDRLAKYAGKTANELIEAGAKTTTGRPITYKDKAHRNRLALWIIQRKKQVLDEYGILVKTVTFDKDDKPTEDMAIEGAFPWMGPGSLQEEEWESSDDDKIAKIKRTFQQPIVLVCFKNGENPENNGEVTLQGSVFWKMSQIDVDGVVRPVWEKTRQIIEGGGVPKGLPTSGNVEGRACFVRDHGPGGEKAKKKTPMDGSQHPHGFYLGGDYIKKQIDEAYLRNKSGWPAISPHFDQQQELHRIEERLERDGAFNPESIEDARERVLAAAVRRRGQAAFRKKLMKAYGGKCAVTGCDMEEALEACHIIPYQGGETNHVTNGLLLRADIHTLFDLGDFTVNTANMTLVLGERMTCSSYADLSNRPLALPQDPSKQPNKAALDRHRVRMSSLKSLLEPI